MLETYTLTLDTLHVSIDPDKLINYQWKRDGIAINGATDASYTLIKIDVNTSISVHISCDTKAGTRENLLSDSTHDKP